jgi:YesN/AraC family two-component response regulator
MDLQGFIIKNVFEELCNQKHKGYVVSNGNNQYTVLVNLKEGIKDDENEQWKEGQKFLKNHFQMTVTIALGEMCEGMKGIQSSYMQAREAMHYKYLLGEGTCICYSVIKKREFSYLASTESKLSKMVIGYMKDSEPTETPEVFVNEILDIYGICDNAAMDTVECFKYEVLSVLNKAIISNRGMIDNRKQLIEELILQPSLETFQRKFTEMLGVLWEKEQQSTEQEDICKKIRAFILNNYRDSCLSVAMLGEEMKVSPYYMSKLFKDKYDISIPDFISQTRIKSAKMDLKNTSKSIKQIAEENGFLSSTVFINIFKKWEGVTPGIFRKME